MNMATKISFIIFSLCFRDFLCVPNNKNFGVECNFRVNVEQHLQNNGFHRNLGYIIHFTNEYEDILPWATTDGCHIGIEQKLPTGLYASPDEVAKYVKIMSQVNIEETAIEAHEIIIHIFSQVKDWKVTVSLPVHARYQPARDGGGKVRNVIDPPRIFLNCNDDKLNCKRTVEVSRTNKFCPQLTSAKCPWKEVPIAMLTAAPTWDVPLGNTHHHHLVAAGTALAVVLGSGYLLRCLHQYTRAQMSKRK